MVETLFKKKAYYVKNSFIEKTYVVGTSLLTCYFSCVVVILFRTKGLCHMTLTWELNDDENQFCDIYVGLFV